MSRRSQSSSCRAGNPARQIAMSTVHAILTSAFHSKVKWMREAHFGSDHIEVLKTSENAGGSNVMILAAERDGRRGPELIRRLFGAFWARRSSAISSETEAKRGTASNLFDGSTIKEIGRAHV